MITVFTPTYNRAGTLPRLYESLKRQTSDNFEWLVIDDGSDDGTAGLFERWKNEGALDIRYHRTENGGKQRAINKALAMARGEFFFIVDSDDMLEDFTVEWLERQFSLLPSEEKYIGLSGIRSDMSGGYLSEEPKFDTFVDASNLERARYGLSADMAEAFITDKLRRYRFDVWPGETFLPEAVVWNRIAADGYILRWFNKKIYRCEYQKGGLSDSFWRLLGRNPMGYAALFRDAVEHAHSLTARLKNFLQYGSCCFLAGNHGYYFSAYKPVWALLLSPAAFALSRRRRRQIVKYGTAKD